MEKRKVQDDKKNLCIFRHRQCRKNLKNFFQLWIFALQRFQEGVGAISTPPWVVKFNTQKILKLTSMHSILPFATTFDDNRAALSPSIDH